MLKNLFITLLLFSTFEAFAASDCLDAPALPAPSGNIITVSTETELQNAVSNLQDGSTILISPGTYTLTDTLWVNANNVTIRGSDNTCDTVELIGKGMFSNSNGGVPHGIWIGSANVLIANMTIRDIYYHPITMNSGASNPHIYNLRLLDAGEQFIKSNPSSFGNGVDNGIVEYTIMEYTSSPPTVDHGGGVGYTNGVDVHAGDGWVIRNNLFKDFHTPDSADHLFNPAILMWNGARNTISENNTFINVDRSIAYGLENRTNDHSGGIIRNNMVFMTDSLFSAFRKSQADASMIIWNSPGTVIVNNTILTNGNAPIAIELRFDMNGIEVANNLTDAAIISREGASFTQSGNVTTADEALFKNPQDGDLHLKSTAAIAIDQTSRSSSATMDFDGQTRPQNSTVDVGADEFQGKTPNPPTNLQVSWL